jgi:hypothetical protein
MEFEEGRRIGRCFPVQVDPDEPAPHLASEDLMFGGVITPTGALLGNIHANIKHPMHTDRASNSLVRENPIAPARAGACFVPGYRSILPPAV